jgi:exonuclease SbcC
LTTFTIAKRNLEEQTELKFDKLLTMGNVTDESMENDRIDYVTKNEAYHTEYITVAGQFDESKPEKKNPELFNSNGIPYFSYQTLENVLCGRIGLSGLTKELSALNKTLLILGDLQLKILTEVFGLVEKQYKAHDDTVRRLNFFFEKNKVSDAFRFKVEFKAREDINIDWIEKMKARSRVHKEGVDLFTLPEDLPTGENTPENLIRNIAKKFYGSVDADTSQLLNPKFYFTLKVKMEDEQGKKNTGSGGQAYTALALLCIGRLSIVQKHQEKNPGIKFIIIEELSNIDDTNFNIFPEIAKQFGYQLMTMTPKPFGSYTNEEWYLHMLVKGKDDKERNYTPMSFFKTKYKKVELDKYLQEQNELEGIKAT